MNDNISGRAAPHRQTQVPFFVAVRLSVLIVIAVVYGAMITGGSALDRGRVVPAGGQGSESNRKRIGSALSRDEP